MYIYVLMYYDMYVCVLCIVRHIYTIVLLSNFPDEATMYSIMIVNVILAIKRHHYMAVN